MTCAKFHVTGRVQGVFFRASARTEALRLKLAGHAKNLDDGSVEVLACGEESALAEFELWLQRGPPSARVEQVRRAPADEAAPPGFRTL